MARGFLAGWVMTCVLATAVAATLAACRERPPDTNFGAEVAHLIDPQAACVALSSGDSSAVCRVNGSLMTCSRVGCVAIQYAPGRAGEQSPPDAAPAPDASLPQDGAP